MAETRRPFLTYWLLTTVYCLLLLPVLLDVGARELVEVRGFAQADLLGLLLGVFDCPAVAEHAADHPEGPDADGSRAVDEGGTVRLVVRQFEKLRGLLLLR